MSIYFFNISCDAFDAEDLLGEECRDVEAARSGALAAAGELIRLELQRGGFPREGWIEIADHRRRPVMRLPLQSAAS